MEAKRGAQLSPKHSPSISFFFVCIFFLSFLYRLISIDCANVIIYCTLNVISSLVMFWYTLHERNSLRAIIVSLHLERTEEEEEKKNKTTYQLSVSLSHLIQPFEIFWPPSVKLIDSLYKHCELRWRNRLVTAQTQTHTHTHKFTNWPGARDKRRTSPSSIDFQVRSLMLLS